MKQRAPVQVTIACLLGFAAAVAAAMCAEYVFPAGRDFSRRASGRLNSETVEYLKNLDERVVITYVVTGRRGMPSSFKRVEKGVVTVLGEMRSAAPDRVEYEVIDPSGSEDLVRFTAEKKVSQYHVENIQDDRKSEKVVWSSLVISMGDRRDVVLHGITGDYVPYLEQIIVGNLKNMKEPVKPVLGLSAPAGYGALERALAEQGSVVWVDLKSEIPASVDMLYIMEPPDLGVDGVSRLRRFIQSGRSIVLADSLYRVGAGLRGENELETTIQPVSTGGRGILKAFGLGYEEKVLMDENCDMLNIPNRSEPLAYPLAVKSNPTAFNLKNFAGTMSGNLGFLGASIITYDPYALKSLGYEIQTVVTSSDKVWTLPLGSMRLSEAGLAPTVYRPKQPLVVLLKNRDPFYGKLLVFGSPSMFSDSGLERAGFGHRPFLKLLGRTFLAGDTLVKMRVDRRLPGPVGAMSPGGVLFWRAAVMFLLPVSAFMVMMVKTSGAPAFRIKIDAGWVVIMPAAFVAGVIAIAVSGRLAGGARMDFTAGKLNSLAKTTSDAARGLDREINIEFYSSPKSGMPPAMKQANEKTLDLLRQLRRLGGGKIKMELIRPEEMNDVDRAAMQAKRITPKQIETTEYDIPVTRELWHGLRIVGGGGESAVPFISEKNVDSMEFFLVSALETLKRGRRINVSVASDMPRLSPAEAYEDFFKKQLSAPVGSDVYSEAKEMLEEYNYQVRYVNPRDGAVPEGTDLFVWLQPRRPVEEMGVALGNHLAAGGGAMVAMQHFNIQQRQYSGRGFLTVYWPQPQYMDLNNYLNLIGVDLKREVLMDEIQSAMPLEMQINRLALREYENQAVSKPFLIRAIPPGFSRESPVTSRLGDLLFIWGNRFSFDEGIMKGKGLRVETLVGSSERAWSYDWSGGFLGEEVFNERKYLEGRQPLAAVVRGTFPPVKLYAPPREMGPDGQPAPAGQPVMAYETAPGSVAGNGEGGLLLIGCSEMFKNPHIREAGFYHGEFLLNAVTYMAMGAEAVELLSKQYVPRGFGQPGEKAAMAARLWVTGAPAALALVFCAVWFALRGRKKPAV